MATASPAPGARGVIPATIAAASVVLAVSVFLPWYTADVSPPFVPESSSGWDASAFARAAFAAAVLGLIAAGMMWLDARGFVPLDAGLVRGFAWTCLALMLLATALVAWRLIRPPGPAEFLTRDVGLFIAQASAIVALVASIGAVRPRTP